MSCSWKSSVRIATGKTAGVASTSHDAISTPTGVFQSIAEGREKNGLRMPAWRELLTEEQIWQATAYVMSISDQSKQQAVEMNPAGRGTRSIPTWRDPAAAARLAADLSAEGDRP